MDSLRWLQAAIRGAFALVLLGGVVTIVGFLTRSNAVRVPAMYVLVAGLVVTGLVLLFGLGVGLYHTYLYFFTSKKPLDGFFATTPKVESDPK